jgi:hypothetical protein
MYRLFVSTDFVGGVKMHFGELKMRVLLTAPIELVWYIQKFLECLKESKCLFHLKYQLHSCPFICFKFVTKLISTNLLESSRSQAFLVSEILTCS